MSRAPGAHPAFGNGTPGQVHLTWGADPATSVVVSWSSAGRAVRPRVRIGQRVVLARERSFTDAVTGKTSWAYHAMVDGLRPGAAYGYAVTADNDASASDPFTSTFRTAPAGRDAFRFTACGDLDAGRGEGCRAAAAAAAGAVESFQPLFHLVNGGVCDATPAQWRGFGEAVQLSAASRPWMPVPGRYEAGDSPRGLAPYLARYALPADGSPGAGGRWYSFRAGGVAFICLDSTDSTLAGPAPGSPARLPAMARWLEDTLAQARADPAVDWVVAVVHQPAPEGEQWLAPFRRHGADLVLTGHEDGYQRSGGDTVHLALDGEIATFDVTPARGPDEPAITITCYHMTDAAAGAPDAVQLDRFTLAHPGSGRPRLLA